jgi:hypothetical protein
MKANVLVVANRTAASDDLITVLRERADRTPARFELLIPPSVSGPEGRQAARRRLDFALARYAEFGLEATGRVGGSADPVIAVIEAYNPGRHDEVVVSTLPESLSHWLRIDGPFRIARATGALVRHVTSREPRVVPPAVHVERPPGPGVLAPLVALGYGPRAHAG